MTKTPCCVSTAENFADSCCPINGEKGKLVQLITLKSLLQPSALEQVNPNTEYFFCLTPDCQVVYFNGKGQTFSIDQIKVPVFQKEQRFDVPVCYCFGWTRERIESEINQTGQTSAEISIRNHIKAKRCGCEVNNPQGSCCLANVRQVTKSLQQNEKQ
ncbi:MAG: (2Fe-2S)-binding protein [Gloeocapsa sp. DLM2.Bin57]|nr:MAG: (2Fe-2S)-binding protein [Gloeocapsa sp. DLM2.Bin57]